MASPELIKRILQQYGVAVASVRPMQTGYRSEIYPITLSTGTLVNLILYKREPGIAQRIKNTNRIGNYVAGHGLPARRTIDDRIIRLGSSTYGALYAYLPGHTIPWEAYTMEHIKALGGTMSTMHALLSSEPKDNLLNVTDEYQAIFSRMQVYFTRQDVQGAMQAKLSLAAPTNVQNMLAILGGLASSKRQQPLHMDFVRGNILFDNAHQVTGILDFEKVAWGDPVFDIARTLAFLMVDCKYKTEAKVRKYFLHSGYNKRGPARFTDHSDLEKLIDVYLLYDFYKFLLHNPYESLAANEHYVRTRDFLLKRNILTLSGMLE